MHIVKIDEYGITFDNGSKITCDHEQEGGEDNFADFEQVDDLARDYNFEPEIKFEEVKNAGFRFGDSRRMFFIPCYSVQSGYYCSAVDIYMDGEHVLNALAELKEY